MHDLARGLDGRDLTVNTVCAPRTIPARPPRCSATSCSCSGPTPARSPTSSSRSTWPEQAAV